MHHFEHEARFVPRLAIRRPPFALGGPKRKPTRESQTDNLSHKNRPYRIRDAKRAGDVTTEIQAFRDYRLRRSGADRRGAAPQKEEKRITLHCRESKRQPNGVRLSCGATLEHSQTQFYHRRRAPTASGAC